MSKSTCARTRCRSIARPVFARIVPEDRSRQSRLERGPAVREPEALVVEHAADEQVRQ